MLALLFLQTSRMSVCLCCCTEIVCTGAYDREESNRHDLQVWDHLAGQTGQVYKTEVAPRPEKRTGLETDTDTEYHSGGLNTNVLQWFINIIWPNCEVLDFYALRHLADLKEGF